MSKLGMHIQIGSDEVLDTLRDMNSPVHKTMDLSYGWCQKLRYATSALLIGRAHVNNQDRYRTDPQDLINEMMGVYAPVIQFLEAIEVPNEVINNSSTMADVGAWDKFQVAFCETAWAMWPDKKIGLFQIPVGNFGYGLGPYLNDFPLSMALPVDKVFICYHSYGWETVLSDSIWYALRYRKIMAGHSNHKMIISECGVTHAVVPGFQDVGFRTQDGDYRSRYIKGLIDFDAELNRDKYVVGACVFNCGPSW